MSNELHLCMSTLSNQQNTLVRLNSGMASVTEFFKFPIFTSSDLKQTSVFEGLKYFKPSKVALRTDEGSDEGSLTISLTIIFQTLNPQQAPGWSF